MQQESSSIRLMSVVVSLIVFGVFTLGLFVVSGHAIVPSNTVSCPFMAHEAVLCPMGIIEHIEAYQATFLGTVANILLVVFCGAVILVISRYPLVPRRDSNSILVLLRYLQIQRYTFFYRPLQALFAQGLLHPKLF